MRRRHFLGTVAGAAVGLAVPARAAAEASPAAAAKTAPLDFSNTRISTVAYPGETVGLWGALPGAKVVGKAVAGAWRGRPAASREIVFGGSASSAFAIYPFEDTRPFKVEFSPATKLPAVWVNRPRVDWVEHAVVYPGQSVRVFGRALHCADSLTIRGGGKVLALQQTNATAFVLESRVPVCSPGTYELLLDGAVVGGVEVVARGADPLGLQVSWANQFQWDKVVPVTLDKAPADSTAAIQAAMDAAAKSGGGVVQLPAGEFGVKHLELPAHVVLMGAGQGMTKLRYLGGEPDLPTRSAPSIYMHMQVVDWENAHPMVTATAGPAGLARMSLISDVALPEDKHRRIEGYVQGFKIEARDQSFFFASDLDIVLPFGSGIRASVASDLLVQRCTVLAPCTGVDVSTHKPEGRATIRGCRAQNQQRPVMVLNASKSIFELNHLIGDNKWLRWCNGEHRISDMGPSVGAGGYTHQYVAGNLAEGIFGTPDENDGEGINWQQATRLAYAKVTAADAASLTDATAAFAPGVLNGATLVIVKGTGLGQVRTVKEHTATAITVEPAWDVAPDTTSLYTIDKEIAAYGCIIVNNSVSGVKKRSIDLYCKNYDNWIQGNTLMNAGGIFLNGTENVGQKRLDMAYFNVVRDNVILGQATDPATRLPQQKLIGTDHGLGWGIRIGNIGKSGVKQQIPGVSVYGNEVRNNTIYGAMPDPRAAGIILGVDTVADTPAGLGNLIEANELHDMPVGIRLGTHVVDTHIDGNRFFLTGTNPQDVERGGAF